MVGLTGRKTDLREVTEESVGACVTGVQVILLKTEMINRCRATVKIQITKLVEGWGTENNTVNQLSHLA